MLHLQNGSPAHIFNYSEIEIVYYPSAIYGGFIPPYIWVGRYIGQPIPFIYIGGRRFESYSVHTLTPTRGGFSLLRSVASLLTG